MPKMQTKIAGRLFGKYCSAARAKTGIAGEKGVEQDHHERDDLPDTTKKDLSDAIRQFVASCLVEIIGPLASMQCQQVVLRMSR
jgi:hypothetical protein